MNRRIQFRDIIIIVLVVILVFQWFDSNQANNKDDNNVTIVLPEEKGSTGEVVLKEVKTDTVYLKGEDKIIVDTFYKEKYEKAKDSLERLNLYLEAIKINEYEGILVNDDNLTITGKAQVRGTLTNYKIDYTIKEKEFTYEPKTIVKQPNLSVGIGVEAGFPTKPETNFNTKVNLDFYNSKGNGVGLSYDSEQRVWLRLSKNFTIKK